MELNEQVLSSLQVSKLFKHNARPITSISYDDTGTLLVTASQDEMLRTYSCTTGKLTNTVKSQKYGCQLARFAHSNTNILYASTKQNHDIRYMSSFDNKFISYYKGHTAPVRDLQLSPQDDTFISCSMDGSVRMWDLGTSVNAIGIINTQPNRTPLAEISTQGGGSPVCCAYDQNGLVFAVGVASSSLHMYDARNYKNGPFDIFRFNQNSRSGGMGEWTRMCFSNDGKYILVSTSGEYHHLIDSFNGKIVHSLSGHRGLQVSGVEASFTPDSKFVIAGTAFNQGTHSQDGGVCMWSVNSGRRVVLDSRNTKGAEWHSDAVRCVAFNPKLCMMASAGTDLAFWTPPNE